MTAEKEDTRLGVRAASWIDFMDKCKRARLAPADVRWVRVEPDDVSSPPATPGVRHGE